VEVKSRQSTQVLDPQLEAELRLSGGSDPLRQVSNEVNLNRAQLLWERRRSIARFVILVTSLCALLSLLIPAKYESTTKLMPPENKSGGMAMVAALAGKSGSDSGSGIGSGLEDLAGDMMGFKGSGSLFIGMLHSRTVEDALIRRFDLRKVYWDRRWEDARKDLESRTFVAEDRKSGIIEVRVRDKNPQRAQAMAQAYDEELDRAVNQLTTSAARREREFLGNRLAGVKKDLDQAAENFSQFASRNTAIDIPEQSKAMFESAASLQGQLMAAEAEEQGLRQIYTPDNIRVRTLRSRIDELRRQLQKIGEAGTGGNVKGDQGDENSADSGENALYPSIRKLPLLGVKYFDLLRQAKIQEALFESLTKRYEMAKVQEAKEIPTVRVLDPANLPERKASPARGVIVLLGFMLSFLVGCVWVIGTAAWNKVHPNDSRKLFLSEVSRDVKRDWARLRARINQFSSTETHNSNPE
jgi:uncharacterized protein involved in exopolysaccharide biosynthesis